MGETFTVFGADGYVGGHLVAHLKAVGHRVRTLTRKNWPAAGSALGNVVFTIGMTADFRGRPFDTVDAHVLQLRAALSRYQFESFLCLSSTRVYRGATSADEAARLQVDPRNPDDIYNVTKLTGEALCLSLSQPTVRVARLSNVYGGKNPSPSFLRSVLDDAMREGHVRFLTGSASSKDYIHITNVCERLLSIALYGRERLYNVASGRNTTHAEIARLLQVAKVKTEFAPDAPTVTFPVIGTSRADREFGKIDFRFAQQFSSLLQRFPNCVPRA